MSTILWMVAGYGLGRLVEYFVTTDFEDEARRYHDEIYDAVRGPGLSKRRFRKR